MNSFRTILIFGLLCGCSAFAEAPVIQISAPDLSKSGVIVGRLGIPLHSITILDGVITQERNTGTKDLSDIPYFYVSFVDGRKLSKPLAFRFRWLFERRKSNPKGHVTLPCYETGEFRGTPSGVEKYVGNFQGQNLWFETTLVVMDPDEQKISISADKNGEAPKKGVVQDNAPVPTSTTVKSSAGQEARRP